MKHSKHDTSNQPALDQRQGLDDRELQENAAENQRARERARADWEHAASHRKDEPGRASTDKPGKGAGKEGQPGPGSPEPTRRRP